MTINGTVEDIPQAYNDCLTFTGKSSEFTLSATYEWWDGTLEWSTDHNTWTTLTGREVIQSVGKKLYLRGKGNTTFCKYGFGVQWNLSEKADCIGNIQTLLDWENPPTSICVNYCYRNMFDFCANLTSAPELPATTLAYGCYNGMFRGCTSLTSAPELPAITLAYGCYSGMFDGCASLTTALELPAITLAYGCYSGMFYGCTSLTSAPDLPATTLADYCYYEMFEGCTSLTTAPELPATTLAERCYDAMFRDCATLTTAPELPATTLADGCYSNMFCGCTNLTSAPKLPATTLTYGCYNEMFYGCTNLTTAPELPATILASNCYSYMFQECTKLKVNTASGNKIFTCPSTIPLEAVDDMFTGTGGTFTGTPTAGNTYYYTVNGTVEDIPQVYNDCLTFTGKSSEFTLKATNKSWDGTLEWSTDHNTWTTLTGTEAMQSVGKKLYLRGKGNTKFCKYDISVRWQLSEKADCIGNIQTLLDWENPPTSISTRDCYFSMFQGCTNLTSAPELPATTLADECYSGMFKGCTNLTTAPVILPATTLADECYSGMFYGCTSLTTAPELPATTLAENCYYGMFWGCTNLATAPVLPATTLARFCYSYMFSDCTKLKVNNTSGNKIFTCPSNIPYRAVEDMFYNTGGTFTGTPTSGNTYYYTVSMR